MKRYKLVQDFAITEENGKPIKNCNLQLYLSEEGIRKEQILNLFNTIACGFTRFLGEETGAYDNSGRWPDFDELDFKFDENMTFDDGTPLFGEKSEKKKGWFK